MAQTIYLRCTSLGEAVLLLAAVLGYGPEHDLDTGREIWPGAGRAPDGTRYDVDFVGTLHAPTGAVIETDEGPTPVLAPIEGYHVNVLWWGETPPDFGSAVVTPATPSRTFAT